MPRHESIVDLETLERFDRQGPRYTSYPTAVEFHEGVGDAAYREALGSTPDGALSLYVHLPFCRKRCRFCACHVVATERDEVAEEYLRYLLREIDRVADALGGRRPVIQLHWGGGTPTYFRPRQLVELHARLAARFDLRPDAEVAIEVDPRVTTFEHLDALAGAGFNRLSMGLQDATEEVQRAIGREQSLAATRRLVEHARAIGFEEGLNVDLVYGLPRQTLESFGRGLDDVVALRPDRLAVYSFAYVPWVKAHQKRLEERELPPADVKLRLMLLALERLTDAGYEPIGMDHFALPHDELAKAAREGRLERNFMGYTVKPTATMIAFGISAIGDLPHGYFQNEKKLSTYYAAIDAGRLPVERGYLVNDDDRVRRYVITQLMCNFRVRKDEVRRRFGVDFDAKFRDGVGRLAPLVDAGFVQVDDEGVTVHERGRLFVRNAAMAFDRYLEERTRGKTVFSRTV